MKEYAKYLKARLLFVDFSEAFDSIHRVNMKQILLAFGLIKETFIVIIIHYKNTNPTVCSSDGDVDFFDIVARVLQGDKVAPYLFRIRLDYVLRTTLIDLIKENDFNLKKGKKQMISCRNYSKRRLC